MKKPSPEIRTGAATPWERIYIAFFVGIFVTSLVAVPISMYGLEALKSNLRLIGAVVITFILGVALAFGLLFLFRRRIAKRLGLPPPGILRDVYDPLVEGLDAVRAGELERAYSKLRHAGAAGISYYSWLTIRWWMVTTSIGLVGVFCTVAGTALLFRHNDLLFDHNRLIVDQNRKINEQNLRIRIQNQLLFAQADVEVSQQLSRTYEEIRRLTKIARSLRQGRDEKVRVRWCDPGAGACSAWIAVERDADACILAETPTRERCGGVPLREIHEHLSRAGSWSPDHEYARRALDVLHHLEQSLLLQADGLDAALAQCGVADAALDDFELDLEQKQKIAALLGHLLHDRGRSASGAGVDGRLLELSVADLQARLRDVQRRLLDRAEPFAQQCHKKAEEARVAYDQKRAQHAELGREVMK